MMRLVGTWYWSLTVEPVRNDNPRRLCQLPTLVIRSFQGEFARIFGPLVERMEGACQRSACQVVSRWLLFLSGIKRQRSAYIESLC